MVFKRSTSTQTRVLCSALGALSVVVILCGISLSERPMTIARASVFVAATTPTEPPAPKIVVYGMPVRLEIPKIGVDAQVSDVGITKEGNMGIPSNAVDVGWYKYSPQPGYEGSSVIVGHLIGPKGEPGVFTKLNELEKGDIVSTLDDKGTLISFAVQSTKSYDQNAVPTEVLNSTSGAHLNLITCAGTWEASQHLYSQRLVIFTDKVK